MSSVVWRMMRAVTGNAFWQRRLATIGSISQMLMGVGAGTSVGSSGEIGVLRMLAKKSAGLGRPLCIVDVGANEGQFLSVVAAELKSVPFVAHSFEPNDSVFKTLDQTHGKDPRVTLNKAGLGEAVGTLELHQFSTDSGLSSVYDRRIEHFGIKKTSTQTVPIDTLDNYCLAHGIGQIDLLKIDVEGHELAVLRGSAGLFSRGAVAAVAFEFGGCNIDSRTYFQDFFYFFGALGTFRLYRVTPSGYLFPIDEYSELLEQFRTTNFVAVRQTLSSRGL